MSEPDKFLFLQMWYEKEDTKDKMCFSHLDDGQQKVQERKKERNNERKKEKYLGWRESMKRVFSMGVFCGFIMG